MIWSVTLLTWVAAMRGDQSKGGQDQLEAVPAFMILKRALTLLFFMASRHAEMTWFFGFPTEKDKATLDSKHMDNYLKTNSNHNHQMYLELTTVAARLHGMQTKHCISVECTATFHCNQ